MSETKKQFKLPKSLLKYSSRFVNAPVSHITSFLVVHELTAVVPLFSLWYCFHKFDFLPAVDLPSWLLLKSTGVIERMVSTKNSCVTVSGTQWFRIPY